jgi:glycosyltransferase involved in cell wall biosynthesis
MYAEGNGDSMDMKKPMFSVFMLCYNHEKYIEEAILSILNQTYQDFELIVADDGSTDNSWEIIQKYSDRIKTFRLEKNDPAKGTAMMLEMANGYYIAEMASDDYWYPDKLELQAKAIQEHPGCYAYFTWAAFTDEKLEITNDTIFSYDNRSRYEWVRTIFDNGTVLAINTVAVVNNKEKWVNITNDSLKYRQLTDQMQILHMLINGDDVYVVPKVLMKVRRHDNCIGVINAETRVRTINENICIWDDMWEKMSDDFFVKAFYNDLYDKQVSDKAEIQCERMLVFLKLAEEKMQYRTTAINYFTRHYDEGVKEILDEKYEFVIENFYELTGKWGWGKIESIYNDYIEDSKCMQEKSGVLKALLKYNHKLINMMDCDMPDVATDKIIFALNDYVDATAETMTVLNTEHTFKYDEWKQLIWSISNGESRKTPDWLEIKKALYAEADRVLEML